MRLLMLLPLLLLTAATNQGKPVLTKPEATAVGPNVKIKWGYTLGGNPDSVITRTTGSLVSSHRKLVAGALTSVDSFFMPRPAPGMKVEGTACTQSKKNNGVYSQDVCHSQKWSYTEPVPDTLPPPIVTPPQTDTSAKYFDETFRHDGVCKRGAGGNGFGWGEMRTGNTNGAPDSIVVVLDGRGPDGCAMAVIFQGDVSGADGWSEPRFRIGGKPKEIFVGWIMASPPNYFHRDDTGPDNNKLLRLWDYDYNTSQIHVGMSTLPYAVGTSSYGKSQMIVEFSSPGGGTGNFGMGPWKLAMQAGKIDTVGFYSKTASAVGAKDGVISVWWNRVSIFHRDTLPVTKAPPSANAYNGFGNGYILGWANSGFTERTEYRILRFIIAPKPPAWFLPVT